MNINESLLHLFESKGVICNFASGKLGLHDTKTIWYLAFGQIDLFAVNIHAGILLSPRRFLTSFEKSALIFGFPAAVVDAKHHIEISVHSNAKLYSMPLSAFQEALNLNSDLKATVNKHLSSWVEKLTHCFLDVSEALNFVTIACDQQNHTLKSSQTITPLIPIEPEKKGMIIWIKTLDGKFFFLNHKSLLLSPYHLFPLPSHAWLTAKTPGTVSAVPFEKVLSDESWQKGLVLFHTLFLELVQLNQEQYQQTARHKIENRKKLERIDLDLSLQKLIVPLFQDRIESPKQDKDPLLISLEMIATHYHFQVHSPPLLALIPDHEKLAAICQTSQIQYRQVHLCTQWWLKESSALLCFANDADQMRPVALIPNGSTGFVLYDPLLQTEKIIDSKNASQIQPLAYTFYQSLPHKKMKLVHLIGTFVKEHKKDLRIIIWSGLAFSIFIMLPAFIISPFFEIAVKGKELNLFHLITVSLILSALSLGIFSYVRTFSLLRLQTLIFTDLHAAFWQRFLSLPMKFFRKKTTASLLYKTSSIQQGRLLLSLTVLRNLTFSLSALSYLIVLFYYSPTIGVANLILLIICVSVMTLCMKKKILFSQEGFKKQMGMDNLILQTIPQLAKVRISGAENRVFNRWASQYVQNRFWIFKEQKIQITVNLISYLLPFIGLFLILTYIWFFPRDISPGAFIALFVSEIGLLGAFSELTLSSHSLSSLALIWQRGQSILKAMPELKENHSHFLQLSGHFHVDQVYFRYDESSPWILKNISIEAKPGELIAIIGPSGCGKSTLLNLLLGFDHPQKGIVYYDQCDLKTLSLPQVRQQIGAVLQNDSIMPGTILENITWGRNASYNQVMEAIEQADFTQDLKEFPLGLSTYLADNGQSLSTGQKQKLLLARAFLMHPRLLILDEALSYLDSATKNLIADNCQRLQVTRVIFTHRLNSLVHADRIYIMKEGSIVASGTFKELVASSQIHPTQDLENNPEVILT